MTGERPWPPARRASGDGAVRIALDVAPVLREQHGPAPELDRVAIGLSRSAPGSTARAAWGWWVRLTRQRALLTRQRALLVADVGARRIAHAQRRRPAPLAVADDGDDHCVIPIAFDAIAHAHAALLAEGRPEGAVAVSREAVRRHRVAPRITAPRPDPGIRPLSTHLTPEGVPVR